MRRSGEAHRAVELIEEYYEQLDGTRDHELRAALERVIGAFKTDLFQALLDLQDLYEKALVSDRKSYAEKLHDTREFAIRWEKRPPFGQTLGQTPLERPATTGGFSYTAGGLNGSSSLQQPAHHHSHSSLVVQERSRHFTNDGWQTSETVTRSIGNGPPQTTTHTAGGYVDEAGRAWEIEDIVLEKSSHGLGISITGGSDQPIAAGDPHIYVTQVIPSGAAALDGRLRTNDIIVRVNNVACELVPHEVAVNALKTAGNVVRLTVRRQRPDVLNSSVLSGGGGVGGGVSPSTTAVLPPSYPPPPPPPPAHHSFTNIPVARATSDVDRLERLPSTYKIDLYKGAKGLGFSIAGGVGNEHVPGDVGIYVTKLIEGGAAEHDGRLRVGDKLLAVDDVSLEAVAHEFAVATLKNTGTRVTLLVQKNPHPDVTAQLEESASRSFLHPITPQRSRNPRVGRNTMLALVGSLHDTSVQQPNPMSRSFESISALNYPQAVAQQEPPLHPRTVNLRKESQGLGFNIVGGEDGEPIYISYVLPGGVADLSGCVRKGDVLFAVNGVSLRHATHGEAAETLKNATNPVILTLQYRPREYELFEEKVERLRRDMMNGHVAMPRRELYVRALFDNDPSRETGAPHRAMAFRHGDVLHIVNADDDEWWTAKKVTENGDEGPEGVIPSKRRVEKRERQRRKQVNFNAGSQSLPRNVGGLDHRRGSRSQLSFSRKFPFVKSTDRLHEMAEQEDLAAAHSKDEPVHSYQVVEQQQLAYPRPVAVFGPLKERIHDALVGRQPNRFSSCVPHTSRPPRAGEVPGRDYHFVTKDQMQHELRNNAFIEAGEYQDNIYGTSIAAVKDVANSGRHCILDVTGDAVRRLQTIGRMFPIVVLVRPNSPYQIMEWDPTVTEDEAHAQFARSQHVEQSCGDVITHVVADARTYEDVLARVYQTVDAETRPVAWVTSAVRAL